MASGGMACVKYLLFFFNFIFWLSGLALVIVGAIIKSKYGDFIQVSSSSLASGPVFLIVIGVIVAVVGFLGCCGAYKENYCMVTTFAVLLAFIFVLEIAAGALAYAYKGKLEGYVRTGLKNGVDHYDKKEYKKAMDKVQGEFKCCGYEDSNDHGYKNSTVPKSCKDTNGTVFSKNCVKGLEKFLKDHLIVVGGVGIGIAFVQLIGIIFACCMMRSIKKEYEVM
ncbi:predicted protein [Nematostella vectensis]|uniref:Tetraspanin n=1 Tax=Nematostella vectensis TaxID=45351 RepID=A7RXD6_NEMVE|nr:predicted protein [Nematostella vectensis]|eukprot:XP_001635890.1 predicted protein [Nematostella vectensis]